MVKTIMAIIFSILIQFVSGQNRHLAKKSIPFKLIDNKYVLINAGVGETKSLTFFLDTGATIGTLDKNIAQKNNIKANYQKAIEGAGSSKTYDIALNQEINVDGLKVEKVHFVLEDLASSKNGFGEPYDGLIGYSLLKDYITEWDFDGKKINLYDFNTKLDLSSYTEHSFTFDKEIRIPQIDVTITLENGKSYTGKVLFDTGAGFALVMNTPYNLENKILEQSTKSITSMSQNFGSKSTLTQIILPSLTFFGHNFSDLPMVISSDTSGTASRKDYLGILGTEIIYRFNFILDYEKKKLYLKPNSLYRNPFERMLTGFALTENENKQIVVSDIIEQSPFYNDGLRSGDEIVSINGIKNNFKEFRKILKTEHTEIVLNVKRGEKTFIIKRTLKRLL